jgi:ferredoxin
MNEKERKWWKGFRQGLRRQSEEFGVSPPPEVEEPTYKVVGEIGRVDQRDTRQSRSMLKPGTPEYEDYYRRHPEHKEWDDKGRAILSKRTERNFMTDPLGAQLQPEVFSTRHLLGAPGLVRGEGERTALWGSLNIDASKMSAEELTQRIKDLALFLGVSKVRVARVKPEWVYTHYAHPYTPEPYGAPVELDYRYVICLAMRQNRFTIGAGDGYIACVEIGWRYSLISLICVTLANLIRSWGFKARALTPENSPYMVVPTFIDAGMGEQGRMGIVVTKEFGNNFRPAAVATDMPLIVDKPVDFGLQDFCDKCEACRDACPVGAIAKERTVARGVHRWQVEDQKCRRYWDTLGHSCAICQASCPWNFDSTFLHNSVRNLNQRHPRFRRLAVKAHKLIYSGRRWNPTPQWAFKAGEARDH